jgi:O-antigen ligase
MCQSRTIFVCVGVLILFFSIYKTIHSKKELWSYLFIIVASYFIAWMLSSRFFTVDIYSNSLFNGVGIKSNSVLGRIESWKFIGKHIFQKPLFGHGPNKSFFYTKNLYSENEYILYMYRYGVIGLIFYLGIFLFPIWRFYKKIKLNTNNLLIIPILIILVSALTNNPFTERNIQIVFCFFFGFCLQTLIRKNDSQKI